MKAINLNEVQEAQGFEKVTAGGYICGITSVEDVPLNSATGKGDFIKLEIDIAEGNFKNYFRNLYNSKGFWALTDVRSYKPAALPFFKAFITSVKNSNAGFNWNFNGENDEKTLTRKLIGCVIGEEEYRTNDGTIKTKPVVVEYHSVDKIRKGDFTIPPLKKLAGSNAETNASTISDLSNLKEILTEDGVPF